MPEWYFAGGLFSSNQLTFFDVHVNNLNAPSDKKLQYGDRNLQVEKGMIHFPSVRESTNESLNWLNYM